MDIRDIKKSGVLRERWAATGALGISRETRGGSAEEGHRLVTSARVEGLID